MIPTLKRPRREEKKKKRREEKRREEKRIWLPERKTCIQPIIH